jgi:hypothetical protein
MWIGARIHTRARTAGGYLSAPAKPVAIGFDLR